ncbi:hypothetical protein [Nocardioides humi]|uniref:SRPBCC family protein n=1 Tax=Nocardioides humi TaxID=449461 RepID=A0ABN1ZWF1_9ACTN|nr:hypothetical protein [Nocardioides humi]
MSARRTAVVLLAAAATGAGAAARARRRLGASAAEAQATLPGDELLPQAQVQNDRACTLPAPPEAVWPWIAQLGQDRAGFYSFETLENLAGCRIVGATRVHLEWQDVAVGDPFRLHPDIALRVAEVDPGRCLVVTSQGGDAPGEMDFATTWTFHLAPVHQGRARATRLHLRERYETRSRPTRLMIEATSVVSAVMTWRMMSRLRTLVTRTADDGTDDRTAG